MTRKQAIDWLEANFRYLIDGEESDLVRASEASLIFYNMGLISFEERLFYFKACSWALYS